MAVPMRQPRRDCPASERVCLRKYGVKVTTIHPDMTDTNLYRDADFTCGEEPESYLLPDEVAKAVAYVLDQREGMVVPEITLRPQLHRIARK